MKAKERTLSLPHTNSQTILTMVKETIGKKWECPAGQRAAIALTIQRALAFYGLARTAQFFRDFARSAVKWLEAAPQV